MPVPFKRFCLATCAAAVGLLSVANAQDADTGLGDRPIAEVAKQPIRYSELSAVTREKLASGQHEYEKRLRQLQLEQARARADFLESTADQLVDDRVLALEATSRKVSVDKLLANVTVPSVPDAEVHEFFESVQGTIDQPFAAVAPQIRTHLEREAADLAHRQYIDSLRQKYKVVVDWAPRREMVESRGPSRGPERAAVTLVEFADFQCPFCRRFEPVLQKVLRTYPTRVRLIYRNFPLRTVHPDAGNSAEAAVCASEQGKFWEMHDVMFADQSTLGKAALREKAGRLGLDLTSFDSCLESGRATQSVQSDEAIADSLGLNTTPTIFVDGRILTGVVSFERLSRVVEDELRRVDDGQSQRALLDLLPPQVASSH